LKNDTKVCKDNLISNRNPWWHGWRE